VLIPLSTRGWTSLGPGPISVRSGGVVSPLRLVRRPLAWSAQMRRSYDNLPRAASKYDEKRAPERRVWPPGAHSASTNSRLSTLLVALGDEVVDERVEVDIAALVLEAVTDRDGARLLLVLADDDHVRGSRSS